jgi:DNA-binding NarL/FixJ family response regulator
VKIRVVVADDHALVREGLARYLASTADIEVVVAVACAEDALAAVAQHRPDVLLLDIDMPGMVVFEAARQIKTRHPDTRVLILSAFFYDRYIQQALAVCASGYLIKGEPAERVAEAIRCVAHGAAYFSPEVRARIVIDPAGARLAVPQTTRASLLSPRELEVLRYATRGLSNKEIAACTHLCCRTVDHHLARIMGKLDIHGRVSLARFAVREGLAEPWTDRVSPLRTRGARA